MSIQATALYLVQNSYSDSNTAATCFRAPENGTFVWKQQVEKDKKHSLPLYSLQTLKYSEKDLQQILQLLPFLRREGGPGHSNMVSIVFCWGRIKGRSISRKPRWVLNCGNWKRWHGQDVQECVGRWGGEDTSWVRVSHNPTPRATQGQEHHRAEAAEFGSAVITWCD